MFLDRARNTFAIALICEVRVVFAFVDLSALFWEGEGVHHENGKFRVVFEQHLSHH